MNRLKEWYNRQASPIKRIVWVLGIIVVLMVSWFLLQGLFKLIGPVYQTATDWISSRYMDLVEQIPTKPGEPFSIKALFDAVPSILSKLPVTLGLTLGGAALGLVLALLFAIVKINRVPFIYRIQAVIVSFLRGTPILVQLLLSYYGIPILVKILNASFGLDWAVDIPATVAVILALALNEAAYASETIRAAIQSVDPGEIEAARSLGMTSGQVYRRVIIPNAAVVATPTLINSLIGLTKGTSLAFNASIVEMFNQALISSGSDYRYFERYLSVAMIYWVISLFIEFLGRKAESSMAITDPKISQRLPEGGDR